MRRILFRISQTSFKLIVLLISISSIISLPNLFFSKLNIGFFPAEFLKSIFSCILSLFTLKHLNVTTPTRIIDSTNLLETYLYSFSILIAALLISLIMSLVITFIYSNIQSKTRKYISIPLSIGASIPDVFIIMLSQYIIIYIYKYYGLKLFQLYGLQSNVYVLPVLCLSFVPFFFTTRYLILLFEEEIEKNYVYLARAKGLSNIQVFLKHILKNILIAFSRYFNIIYWNLLSGLFIVEYLFLMKGFTIMLYKTTEVETRFIGALLILFPYFILSSSIQLVKFRRGIE